MVDDNDKSNHYCASSKAFRISTLLVVLQTFLVWFFYFWLGGGGWGGSVVGYWLL
jgi:hypothetical protein